MSPTLAAISGWTAPIVIVALSILVAGLTSWFAWRAKAPRRTTPLVLAPAHEPLEAAFDAVARASGLGDEDRALIRALAGAHGEAQPVALLISSHAFDTARRRFGPNATSEVRRAASALRSRLFAGA